MIECELNCLRQVLNLLDIKKIRLGSLLPGLIMTPVLVQLFADNTGLLR